MEIQQGAGGSSPEMSLETGIVDLRAIPPSAAWQEFRRSRPAQADLLAQVQQLFQRLALELGLQDSSWSVDSLWALGAVADVLNSQIRLLRVAVPSGRHGQSMLNEQLLNNRALRVAQKKLQREAAAARKAAESKS